MASGSVDEIEMASAILILVVSSGRPNQYTANHSVSTVGTSQRAPTAALPQCANTTKRFLSARNAEAAASVNTIGFAVDAPCAVAETFAGTVD